MDPNNYQNPSPSSGNIYGAAGQAPPPQPRHSLKKIILIAAAVIIVAIIVAVLLGGNNKDKGVNQKSSRDASTYITRAGYEDENDGIGDAAAITASPSDKVTTFGGTNVIQPCALITLDDLKANQLLLNANSLTGPVSRQSYGGDGVQKMVSEYSLPSGSRVNNCDYHLKNNEDVVAITVYQPFDTSARAIQGEITRSFAPIADVGGLKAYKATRANSFNARESTFLVKSANAHAELRVSVPEEATKDKLLGILAERLKKAETTPTPAVTFSYKSPVMSTSVFTSCAILSDASYRQVVGGEPGAATTEKFASSIGVVRDPDGQKLYNYTSYDCQREGPGLIGSGQFTLMTRTYEFEEAAKKIFKLEQEARALATDIQKISGVGDEAFFGNVAALNNAFGFRKGRLIVLVSYNPDRGTVTTDQRISALRPVMEAAAKSISGF